MNGQTLRHRSFGTEFPRERLLQILILAALAVLSVAARVVGFDVMNGDMALFIDWSNQLVDAGGVAGLANEIGNYNAPFLYVLLLSTWLPGPQIFAIKLVFVVFDVLVAYYVYRLVAVRHTNWPVPALAAGVAVLLPTVVVNASWYGQCDAMYAGFALGATYYLLRGRPWLACSFAGIAVAFKPQGIFILPIFLLLAVSGRLRWRHLAAIPGVYLLLDVPALLVGRDPVKLLTIYTSQANQTPGLANSGPSLYQWIPVGPSALELRGLAYALTATVVLIACYAVVVTRSRLEDTDVILGATFLALAVPFFMPGMHERYFFLGDLLSLVLVFYLPRLWYVPALVQASSFLSYLPFMYGDWSVPGRSAPEALPGMVDYRILSLVMAAATVATAYTFFTRLGVWRPWPTDGKSGDGSGAAAAGNPDATKPSEPLRPMAALPSNEGSR